MKKHLALPAILSIWGKMPNLVFCNLAKRLGAGHIYGRSNANSTIVGELADATSLMDSECNLVVLI